MSKINIDGSDDPFYRYKMQKVIILVEKGNTILININSISKELNRTVEELLKFLKGKLNTSITNKQSKIKIAGIVSIEKIQNLIFEYINTYVLCKSCKNPETTINKSKLCCGACGNKGQL